jgi:hypothetical protein
MSKDCKELYLFCVTPATTFDLPEEVVPALIHAAKGQLLSQLRCCSVRPEGIQRLRVYQGDRAVVPQDDF